MFNRAEHIKKMVQISAEKVKATTEKRFWDRVNVTGDMTECWEWKFKPSRTSFYPYISCRAMQKNTTPVHRVAYWLHYGHPEKGKHICHKCGNRFCCNPYHLYAGTPKTNHEDAVKHGTFKPLEPKCGEEVYNSKLTIESVVLARRIWPFLKKREKETLSKLMGVTRTHLRRVVRGEGWHNISDL